MAAVEDEKPAQDEGAAQEEMEQQDKSVPGSIKPPGMSKRTVALHTGYVGTGYKGGYVPPPCPKHNFALIDTECKPASLHTAHCPPNTHRVFHQPYAWGGHDN
jgi:hypothetical protein